MKGTKATSGLTPAEPSSDHDWRAESDHRTLMEAGDIQSDKSRMAGVSKHHKRQTKKMALVQRNMLQGGGR